MSEDLIPLKWLLSRLHGAYVGRMGIVICGGPSAPNDIAKIPNFEDAVLVSANAHAFKLRVKPKYIWCKDHERVEPGFRRRGHPKQYMEPELRKYNTPILGPNYWCDYRAINWPLNNANSGMQAMAALALMGCRPIVPVGMDCFQGDTYFHNKDAPNVSNKRRLVWWQKRMELLREALRGADVRGVSGLVLEYFGRYDKNEAFAGPPKLPGLLRSYVNLPTQWVRTRRAFQETRDKTVEIPADYIMASSKAESDKLTKLGLAEPVLLFNA